MHALWDDDAGRAMIPDVPPWAWKALAIAVLLYLVAAWLWILSSGFGDE